MKRLFLLLFLLLAIAFKAISQEYYYWYQHQKILLEKDSSVFYVEFEDQNSANEFLQKNSILLDDISFYHYTPKRIVFNFKSKNAVMSFHQPNVPFHYTSPALKYKQSRIIIIPQIILMLRPNFTINDVLIKYKDLISYADSLDSNEYLLNVNTNSFKDVLFIANNISEKSNMVKWCEPNFYNSSNLADDPLFDQQYYLYNTGQNGGTQGIDIDALKAWDITKGDDNIRVAVIDEGVSNHEDFNGRVMPGYTAGYPNKHGAPVQDYKSHGEYCAGIIAATHDNDIGIKGIDPTVKIMPVNIFPYADPFQNGIASIAQIVNAINWARGNSDVLSCSWGVPLPSSALTNAITNARTLGRNGKGCLVVFASGNGGSVYYPADINGVITVGAIQNNGTIWNYSGTGPSMDLVAPSGVPGGQGDIVTTDLMGSLGSNNGNYTLTFGGTSAACPQVAGVACLMLSVSPNLTETQIRTILQQTATDMGPTGFDNTYGYGRVDACEAVGEAISQGTISGEKYLCSSSTYSISSAINENLVSWSASPSNLVSLSSNGDQVTLTKLSNGIVTLIANITASCGNFAISKSITVGPPSAPALIAIPSSLPGEPTTIDVYASRSYGSINPIPGATYNWYRDGSLQGGHGDEFIWYIPCNHESTLTCEAITPCGTSPQTSLDEVGGCKQLNIYTVSPNPAIDQVTISANTSMESKKLAFQSKVQTGIKAVRIIDLSGRLIKQFQYPVGTTQTTIDVSSLSAGTYLISIYNGVKWYTKQVVIAL